MIKIITGSRVTSRYTMITRMSSYPAPGPLPIPERKKVTINSIRSLYKSKVKITMITAHDYPSAFFASKAKIDITLIGDSLAMVALGLDSTNDVTMNEMIHHSKAVARGGDLAFRCGDMPFGSYEISPEWALTNAIRYVKEVL